MEIEPAPQKGADLLSSSQEALGPEGTQLERHPHQQPMMSAVLDPSILLQDDEKGKDPDSFMKLAIKQAFPSSAPPTHEAGLLLWGLLVGCQQHLWPQPIIGCQQPLLSCDTVFGHCQTSRSSHSQLRTTTVKAWNPHP